MKASKPGLERPKREQNDGWFGLSSSLESLRRKSRKRALFILLQFCSPELSHLSPPCLVSLRLLLFTICARWWGGKTPLKTPQHLPLNSYQLIVGWRFAIWLITMYYTIWWVLCVPLLRFVMWLWGREGEMKSRLWLNVWTKHSNCKISKKYWWVPAPCLQMGISMENSTSGFPKGQYSL